MMELVEIHWWDTQDADKDKTWMSSDEVEEFAKTTCDIYSVGWIVKRTRHYITICSDFTPDPDTHGRVTKIPKGMIRAITPLEKRVEKDKTPESKVLINVDLWTKNGKVETPTE